MGAELLTTVARVKAWLSTSNPPTTEDVLFGTLVLAASTYIRNNINRDVIVSRTISERRDGNGQGTMMLRHYPVTSYTSLSIDNNAIAVSAPIGMGAGYFIDTWDGIGFGEPASVELFGYGFGRGRANVVHVYTAGYLISGEATVIPSTPFQITAQGPDGPFARNVSVTINGVAAVAVASAPTAGQYVVSSIGVYTFAAADAGKTAALSYGYIPASLEQAAFECVAERYRYRDRIGQISKSQGGEVISFSTKAKSDYVKDLLQPFTRVVMP